MAEVEKFEECIPFVDKGETFAEVKEDSPGDKFIGEMHKLLEEPSGVVLNDSPPRVMIRPDLEVRLKSIPDISLPKKDFSAAHCFSKYLLISLYMCGSCIMSSTV